MKLLRLFIDKVIKATQDLNKTAPNNESAAAAETDTLMPKITTNPVATNPVVGVVSELEIGDMSPANDYDFALSIEYMQNDQIPVGERTPVMNRYFHC